MAAISNLGVGSSLDLSSLYDKLEAAEKSKLKTITTQQTNSQSKLTALGKLQSSLQSLQTATTALAKVDTFNATAVTSTNTAFSATTASSAVVGSYSVSVSQIASAQTLVSGSLASNTAPLGATTGGTRTLSIQQGSGTPITLTLTDDQTSLANVVKAINTSGANVAATTIKGSDGNFHLLLSSKATGTSNDMTISVSGDDTLQAAIGYSAGGSSNGMSVQTASKNAKLEVNGIAIESASNTVNGAPEGVTLTLKSATTAPENLEVSRSVDSVKTAIKNFVTAYNNVNAVIASATKYTPVAKGDDQASNNGALLGDNTVRTVQARLRSLISSPQSGGSVAILAQLGITQDPTVNPDGSTGNLVIDDTKLTKALNETPQAVTQFFVGDGKTTGLSTQLGTSLTDMLSTSVGKEGLMKNATDGINSKLDLLGDRYEAMQDRIDATMARYKAQFTQLDSFMSKMNATSSYLTQQFSSSSDSK